MNRNYSIFLISISIICRTEAAAMPLAPISVPAALTIPAASGCGLGVRRGPYDGCYPVYGYYAGHFRGYRNPYYAGPVSRGVCGGRGRHLACNHYGMCRVACN
jgi:hypothetical protein